MVFGVACAIALLGLGGELTRPPRPKHPDRKDVQLSYGEVFFVRMGKKTAVVGFEYDGRFRIGTSRLSSWIEPHQTHLFSDEDREAVKFKLKNVLEAEGTKVIFK